MSLFKRLFGGKGKKEIVDKHGLYFYVQCDRCGSKVRVRADRQHDLNREGDGYVWHKTIVDSSCFRRIPVVVHMNAGYEVTEHEIEGGRFISETEYQATGGDASAGSP